MTATRCSLPHLLAVLRIWWKEARPPVWLFPSPHAPFNYVTPKSLNRAFHEANRKAGIKKVVCLHTLRYWCFATHLLEQKVDVRVIQVLLGFAAALETTAAHTHIAAKTLDGIDSPLDLRQRRGRRQPGGVSRRYAPGAGGRRHLPQPWVSVAAAPGRPPELGQAQGNVGDRPLHGKSAVTSSAGEDRDHIRTPTTSCRNRHCPKCQGRRRSDGRGAPGRELLPLAYYHVVFTLPAQIGDIAFQKQGRSTASCSRRRPRPLLTHRRRSPGGAGGPHRPDRGPAHLGSALTHHPQCAPHRPQRWPCWTGQSWICVPPQVLPAGARALAGCSAALFLGPARRGPRRRAPDVLRGHRRPRRSRGPSPRASPRCGRAEWVVYASVLLRRPGVCPGLSRPLHPPRRHIVKPPGLHGRQGRHLPLEGLLQDRPAQADDPGPRRSLSAASSCTSCRPGDPLSSLRPLRQPDRAAATWPRPAPCFRSRRHLPATPAPITRSPWSPPRPAPAAADACSSSRPSNAVRRHRTAPPSPAFGIDSLATPEHRSTRHHGTPINLPSGRGRPLLVRKGFNPGLRGSARTKRLHAVAIRAATEKSPCLDRRFQRP